MSALTSSKFVSESVYPVADGNVQEYGVGAARSSISEAPRITIKQTIPKDKALRSHKKELPLSDLMYIFFRIRIAHCSTKRI